MLSITQKQDRQSQEQARGGRQVESSIENISTMVQALSGTQRNHARGGEQLLEATKRLEDAAQRQREILRELSAAADRVRRALASA